MIGIVMLCLVCIVAIILNFGMVFACLQRRMLHECEDSDVIKRHIFYSVIISIPGPLTITGIYLSTAMNGYGIKFFPGEIESKKNVWFYKLEDINMRKFMDDCKKEEDRGRCKSIW